MARYLISGNEVKKLTDNEISDVSEEEKKSMLSLSKKQMALNSGGLVITDNKGNILKKILKKYGQHFYPLSILDYAKSVYDYAKNSKPFPILSIDSHDVLGCDFNCKDCLSRGGENLRNSKEHDFNLNLENYSKILREIYNYSKKRGFEGIRFEQSGEGNPDFFKQRPELIKLAKEEYSMKTVYITSGSFLNEELIDNLAKYAHFVRISFPGIDDSSYEFYSGQSRFRFDDSLEKIKKLIQKRKEYGRENELLIGVRGPLRPKHKNLYYSFIKKMKDIGVDAVQLVKLLMPSNVDMKDYPISEESREELEKAKKLEDRDFNVQLPHDLDFIYYEREIQDKKSFPPICYSAMVQPVLTGKDLFVCTKSDMMYSQEYSLGRFKGKEGEIEEFMESEKTSNILNEIPEKCMTCCSLFDNIFMHEVYKLAKTQEELNFYEIIE